MPTVVAAGHQADHTAGYVIGAMAIVGPPPAGYPNPGAVIPNAVPTAVAARNNEIGSATPASDLLICSGTGCGSSNTDGFTVTVKLEGSYANDFNASCGVSTACLKYVPGDRASHLEDMELVFEERAWQGARGSSDHFRFHWTDVEADHLRPAGIRPAEFWSYVGVTMLHEFGHTLGLPDFADASTHRGVMKNPHMDRNLTRDDIDYLLRIYSGHSSTHGLYPF